MANFTYSARSRAGQRIEGTLQAGDRRAALLQIERLGYVPIAVKESAPGDGANAPATFSWRDWLRFRQRGGRLRSRELLLFTSELSDLLASGMKLGNALNTLARRRTNPDSDRIIKALRDNIIQGRSLSEALAQFPESFPALYISLIRSGEASGNQPAVMQRIVKYYERLQEVKEKVIMALVYPLIVLTVGVATLIFSMIFVIPRFAIIFQDLGSTLPLPTRILIGLSSAMLHYGWLLIAAAILLAVLFRRYLASPAGRLWWHGLLLRMPLIREIIAANAFTQFASTLGMLIANGVAVLDALSIGEQTVQNMIIASEIRKAKERVSDGTSISGPLAAGKVFPAMLTDMLAIGEETGDMSGALAHIARRYEALLDRQVKIFTTVLEPILIVLMAVVVGFVAISILLAVFDLTSGLNV